ncbi:NADH dehydrogenase subunit M [Helicobacter canis]|uniref:NADH dehydrogenase subunit M n=1 Tax=Helicobacter canis TaxID=29419 RepID=A0A377J646_9HELI|nr:NADH-quinone oxidoreductase subunit M [Helicobacter canis]STO97744.1 NADH dehydrogenase subunit M [Helicobacter canis]
MEYLLSIVIFFPFMAGLVVFALDDRGAKFFGVSCAMIELVLVAVLCGYFDSSNPSLQFENMFALIPAFGISYHIGIDGVSLTLILLNAIVILLSVMFLHGKTPASHFVACLLLLESILMGVFSAQNLVLFYVFWELSLLPILYMIGVWGSGDKIKAALQFFLYTFFASLIMLVGILYYGFLFFLHFKHFSFELADWLSMPLPPSYQLWLFLAFFIAIAVKIPIIPFHAWLPKAYGNAPTLGSVVLSALLLKMGTYALVRFCLPLFPDASIELSLWILVLGLIMIIYGAMLAYAQTDMKQVIAYSSISHMGVVVLGVFSFTLIGISGAVFMMFAHGIVGAMLFMLVGAFAKRTGSMQIDSVKGVAAVAPIFCAIFGLATMANVGLPLTIGFVGEFLSLLGIFATYPLIALLGGLTIILSAAYMLSLYKRLFFGKADEEQKLAKFSDVDVREKLVLGLFSACVIVLGVYPKPLLTLIDSGVKPMLETMSMRAQNSATKTLLTTLESKQERTLERIKSSSIVSSDSVGELDFAKVDSSIESSSATQADLLFSGEAR